MGWFSPFELLILIAVVLLVFGPKRLPEIGKSMGKGIREFKDSVTGKEEKERAHAALAAASAAEEQAAPPQHASDSVSTS